jgi:tetratricopeptide (TPR) repeat protein
MPEEKSYALFLILTSLRQHDADFVTQQLKQMEKIKWIEEYIDEANRLIEFEGHESALKLVDKLLYEEPGYGRLHYTLGYIYLYHAENSRKAEQHFRFAIRFDPAFANSYEHLGNLLSDDERFDEAIEIFKQGLDSKKANKTALLSGAAKAYELNRKYRRAISHYRKALSYSAELWRCQDLEEDIKRCKRKQK